MYSSTADRNLSTKVQYDKVVNNIRQRSRSRIKDSFRDETDAAYIITSEGLLCVDTTQFDEWASRIYETTTHQVISWDTIKNVKRIVRASITDTRTLYYRVARIDDILYYDLADKHGRVVKITKEGWQIIDNPYIFKPKKAQVEPTRAQPGRRYLREIFDQTTIIYPYQKTILEVYVISLFVEGLHHPIIAPEGVAGSGKSMLFERIALMVDPHDDTALKKLRDDIKDRRISIHSDYFSCFDNVTHLSDDQMDDLCMWVTGYGEIERRYYTNNEKISYSGTRPIGINGINIPISNSDALDRTFIINMIKQLPPKLWSEVLESVRNLLPEILAHIFDILSKALRTYDDVRMEIKPEHRLADWLVFGEVISRALGNSNGVFLDAWMLNVQDQSQAAIDNNPLAQLIIEYTFEQKENPVEIKPEELLRGIRSYAVKRGIEYHRSMPQNPVWLTRGLNSISENLKQAGICVEINKRSSVRYLRLDKKSVSHSQGQ